MLASRIQQKLHYYIYLKYIIGTTKKGCKTCNLFHIKIHILILSKRSSDNIKQLVGNGLLTRFIILKR